MRRTMKIAATAVAMASAIAVPASAHRSGHPAFAAPAGPALGIKHVFVIVLENKSFKEAYDASTGRYLSSTLAQQGTLLTQYYGVAHLSNPNYIAMMSGQGPNPLNQSDCQDYVDFEPSPAVMDPRGNGQAVGQGCVYPSNVLTLPDQLAAKGLTWHGYMEDMGNDTTREPAHCGEPASSAGTGMQDGTQTAKATDQYAARHNPFVYFHSLIDSGSCHANVVPLSNLTTDLASADTTPNFSFITPDLCSDGHDSPCADGRPGGLASIDDFLSTWIPRIQASPAYQQDGLIVITTDESEWNQSQQDSTACCGEQVGPDSPMPGITGPGGGLTGALLVGRCVAAGQTDATPYNHYSLLRSLEDLFGVTTGGADGKGHLGYAAGDGVSSFGPDVFSACPDAAPTAVALKG
ncbi:MAG TPA: alkaline phosphatase family protein [Mycobacteriales bacterium]|nr:alkaline phosphatase family protein [Mycobacteriales bacterium]